MMLDCADDSVVLLQFLAGDVCLWSVCLWLASRTFYLQVSYLNQPLFISVGTVPCYLCLSLAIK